MFDHDMLESCQRHVDIPDISIDVMKDLVRFIYTGVAPNLETLAPELLAAADKVSDRDFLSGTIGTQVMGQSHVLS